MMRLRLTCFQALWHFLESGHKAHSRIVTPEAPLLHHPALSTRPYISLRRVCVRHEPREEFRGTSVHGTQNSYSIV